MSIKKNRIGLEFVCLYNASQQCCNVFNTIIIIIIILYSPFNFRSSLILYSFWQKKHPKLKILFILFMEHCIVRGGIKAFEICEVGNECRHNAHEKRTKHVCLWFFKWFFGTTTKNVDLYESGFMHRCNCLCVFARSGSCKFTHSLRNHLQSRASFYSWFDENKCIYFLNVLFLEFFLLLQATILMCYSFFFICERVIASLMTISRICTIENVLHLNQIKSQWIVQFNSFICSCVLCMDINNSYCHLISIKT